MMDFAGSGVDVPASQIILFFAFVLFLVFAALYFNLKNGHTYVDEHWGAGDIDDEDWGFSLAEAKAATRRRLAELADRADAHG
ncbi:MAG: hypothetical protein JO148_01470 [Acidimicrobiia bacterium]|nr:hypothetical protein [Acidimicrobiia bacterium]